MKNEQTNYSKLAHLHEKHNTSNRKYDSYLFDNILFKDQQELKKVLEVGSGHGHFANRLLKTRNPEKIIGVDLDRVGVESSNHEYKNEKISFYPLTENGEKIKTIKEAIYQAETQLFDTIYSMYVFEVINNKETINRICKEIYDLLSPGGTFTFMIGNPEEFQGRETSDFYFEDTEVTLDGDTYLVGLNVGNDEYIVVKDFHRTDREKVKWLKQSGFTDISIIKPYINHNAYEGVKDEAYSNATMIVSGRKPA